MPKNDNSLSLNFRIYEIKEIKKIVIIKHKPSKLTKNITIIKIKKSK